MNGPDNSRFRIRRLAAWSGGALGMLLVLCVSLLCWLLFSTSGARWLAARVTQRFAPQVSYGAIDGTLAGELRVQDFRFESGPEAAKIRIEWMAIDPTLSMLLSRTLRIERARVRGLTFTLPAQSAKDEPEDKGLWVEPPLEVVVRDFALEEARVFEGRKQLVHLRQLVVAARWSREALVIERLELLPGDIEGTLAAQGRITPQGDTVRATLKARWREVIIPAEMAGRVLATAGELDLDGTPQRYAARGDFEIGPPGDLAHVLLVLDGTQQRATLKSLDVTQSAGRLHLGGEMQFRPDLAWNLEANAEDFNPGVFLARWPGRIDLELSTRGTLEEQGPRGTLRISTLSGELRGRALSGQGEVEFAAPARLSGVLQVRSGRSRVAVRGSAGDAIDASIDLEVASLNDWMPDARGSLTGKFRVRGQWPDLTLDGSADGKALAYFSTDEQGERSVLASAGDLRLQATAKSLLEPSGVVKLEARDVQAAGMPFTRVKVDASGDQARHRVTLEAEGARLEGLVEVSGGLTAGGWQGELSRLQLAAVDLPRLSLREPARVVFEAGAFDLGETCLLGDDSALCLAGGLKAGGELLANYSFERVPLSLANVLAAEAMPGQLQGELQGAGRVRRAANGQWFGEARLTSPVARLELQDEGTEESVLGTQVLLLYEDLELKVRLLGTHAEARLSAALDHGGTLTGTLAIGDLTASAPTLRGDLGARIPTLAPFAAFIPSVGNVDGVVDAKLQIAGTTAAPVFSGNASATGLQADLGQLGIKLRAGELQARALRGGGFRLEGQVESGKGQLGFRGSMSERGDVDIHIRGENFQAAGLPAADVVITPDLDLTGDPEGYLLKGEVAIVRARINLQKLPRDGAPGTSPDVVVVRNGEVVESASQKSDLPLTAVIRVNLGEQIEITGYGLDARVFGQLEVRETPGAVTTGSGQLTVVGQYQAYGQDLKVEEGRLLFAGTPIDNPRLSIIAMRDIDDDLSTGLRITGSARRPIITVVSDPEVGEADALSYLVTGRSLADVDSASGSSQDTLASATRSLQGAAGGLVAKRIGQRLGLDEAGVEENEMIGGSALTIGEYLSPRLYLSYGVGLFEPGEVIALRYKLTDDIGVKIERGSMETRTGVEYRIER